MEHPPRAAGGCFLVLAMMAGLIIGIWQHQMMGGLLAGTAIGVAAAVIVWLIDRRR